MAISQTDLIQEYYMKHPNRDIPHQEAVDWLTEEYRKRTGGVFRDPDRGIRKLHEEGFLQKIGKGVYRYDPEMVQKRELFVFNAQQREEIFERDDYRCVFCGIGRRDGVEIHVDHIVPMSRGGEATVDNGQTLCSTHNFRKKTYSQTESGKRMFINLLRIARKVGDTHMENFCLEVLSVYDKHNINGHIDWE